MSNDFSLSRDVVNEVVNLVSHGPQFSDLHIEQDSPMMIKTPREWREVEGGPVTLEEMYPVLMAIDGDWKTRIESGAIDLPYVIGDCRLRCNIFLTCGGRKVAMSIRRLPLTPMALEKTGLPQYVRTMLEPTRGLILVTGPTGAGKTTTIASMLDHINATRSSHIVTIEQPVEYELARRKSIFSHKEVPRDTPTFSSGLREALRQRPDVIMVGEIRDFDTADTVLHASESGHLVLATMHTNSAIGAISKLLSFYPSEQRDQRAVALANSLIGVICQSLVPSETGDSLVLASELIFNHNQQAAQFIASQDKFPMLSDFMRRGDDNMSRSLNEDLTQLVRKKQISQKDAMRASYNRIELHDMLGSKRP